LVNWKSYTPLNRLKTSAYLAIQIRDSTLKALLEIMLVEGDILTLNSAKVEPATFQVLLKPFLQLPIVIRKYKDVKGFKCRKLEVLKLSTKVKRFLLGAHRW
jgi:hypothetical protein